MCANNPTTAFGCAIGKDYDTAGEVYVGAWCDLRHKVVTNEIFDSHIEFQPVFIQRGETVAIPMWRGQEKGPPKLCVDMYGPSKTDEGAVFAEGEDMDNYDTYFTAKNDTGDIEIIHNQTPDEDDDTVIGWVYRGKDDTETEESANRVYKNHKRASDPFYLAGICGAMQPDNFLPDMLCYVVLLSGSVKVAVDEGFYDRPWAPGDEIYIYLGNDRNHGELKQFDVIYRHKYDDVEKDFTITKQFKLGIFIVEGVMPHCPAAHVLLTEEIQYSENPV